MKNLWKRLLKRLDGWATAAYCASFGHDLLIPQFPNPFAPIRCKRCGWTLEIK